jgi:hypothetical protein
MKLTRILTAAAAAIVLALIGIAPAAQAQPGGTTPQDDTYYYLITTPDDDGTVFNVTDFGLLRAQGLGVCRLIDNGMSGVDATEKLMSVGPYSWDAANFLSSAAQVAYCPDNIGDW